MNEQENPLPAGYIRFEMPLDQVAAMFGKSVQEVAHLVSLYHTDFVGSFSLDDLENLEILECLGLITILWAEGY